MTGQPVQNDPAGPRPSIAAGSIAILALLATFNTLPNGFTYDDRFIIVGNPAVQQITGWQQFLLLPYWPLHQGGDGYRPLTTLLFAIQWAVTHDPWFFHAVSIALYVTACLALLWLCRKIVGGWAAWWTAAVFAVHPVHVEATAGVVGQAELAAGALMIIAVGIYMEARKHGSLAPRAQGAILGLFLAACLFKEHGIMLPALLVLAEWAFVRSERPWRARAREVMPLAAGMLAVASVYLAVRLVVVPLGILGFAPYTPFVTLDVSPAERVVTMLGIVPHWFRLMFLPIRLSPEYGPPRYGVGGSWGVEQWVGLVLLVAAAVALVVTWRRARTVAFAILWSAILLIPVSNVFFPSGVLLAERTLFAPSVGACLLIGIAISWAAPRVQRMGSLARTGGLVAAGGILLFGVVRSIVRDADWRDNESLFTAAVSAEPRVYRAHYMLGAWYLENGRWPLARPELTKAMSLFDRDPAVAYNLGIGYFGAGDYPRAFEMFATVDRVMPGVLDAKTKMALTLAADGKLSEAREAAAQALQSRSEDPAALRAIIRAAALADKVARTQRGTP